MIQHEYDHTEGMLYIDYLKPLARKLLESKLARVAKGQVRAKYPMKFV
jgi:N-formylmethionyl-tRNA deformylase